MLHIIVGHPCCTAEQTSFLISSCHEFLVTYRRHWSNSNVSIVRQHTKISYLNIWHIINNHNTSQSNIFPAIIFFMIIEVMGFRLPRILNAKQILQQECRGQKCTKRLFFCLCGRSPEEATFGSNLILEEPFISELVESG